MLDSFVFLKLFAAILPVAATLTALPGRSQAAESGRKAVVVVYGDGTHDRTTEVMRFAQLPNPHDRPDIRAGRTGSEVPQDGALVWFGDLTHEENELLGVPADLARVAAELGRSVADRLAGLVEGEVRLGVNYYTRHVEVGFPASYGRKAFYVKLKQFLVAVYRRHQ